MDIMDHFPDRVFPEPNTGCWLCVSSNNKFGYARIRVSDRLIGAHRISYQITRGSIPDGFEIDHLCRVTCCVNPDHLEAVTQEENKRRQALAIETANGFRCKSGHLRIGEGIYHHPRGERRCRECARISRLRYKARKRQQISAEVAA